MADLIDSLTDRQKREKDYYEQYAEMFDVNREVDFSPVISQTKRPWNSYWLVYEIVAKYFRPQAKLLDFGSGPGDNAVRFARIGYQVEGFDISKTNVNHSFALFRKYHMESLGHFQVSAAESLPYKDEEFDFVVGIDILHHVDIFASIKETHRVLKPNGVAIFREPLRVPILDTMRNTWPVKLLAPKVKSFELHITEDERKLNRQDLAVVKSIFPKMIMERFFFLARLDKFMRNGSDPQASWLEKIDQMLFKFFPPLKYLGGAVIIILKKD